MTQPIKLTLLLILVAFLQACVSNPIRSANDTEVGTKIQSGPANLKEQQLLDVWVEIFDEGKLSNTSDATNSGLTRQIRRAESHYFPAHLKHTLQSSGQWGAVRVVPKGTTGAELLVQGTILQSNGSRLSLEITATDAGGNHWFTREYQGEADHHSGLNERGVHDPFQHVYNQIANDLAQFKATLTDTRLSNIRTLSELRFAADLAPEPYSGYLGYLPDDNGETSGDETARLYLVRRLPAREDPIYQRVLAMRERDNLLIDTLDQHYEQLYDALWEPYLYWRENRHDEAKALEKVQDDATERKLLGLAAIAGAIAIEVMGGDSRNSATDALSTVMIVGGVESIKSGYEKEGETAIHEAALEELGESLGTEVTPLVMKVEGETIKLSGSAEEIYQRWRKLIKRIYANETGVIADQTLNTP